MKKLFIIVLVALALFALTHEPKAVSGFKDVSQSIKM